MKKLITIFNELNELNKDLECYNLWVIERRYHNYFEQNKPIWNKLKDVLAMNYVFMEEDTMKEVLEKCVKKQKNG